METNPSSRETNLCGTTKPLDAVSYPDLGERPPEGYFLETVVTASALTRKALRSAESMAE
jgi:hypothetical protein